MFAPTTHQKTPEIVSKTLSKPLADKLPKESEGAAEKKTLLAALKTYLAQKSVLHGADNPDPNGRVKVPPMYSNKYHAPQLSQHDEVLPKDDKENTYQIQSYLQRPQARVLTRPNLGTLIYKSSSRQENPKEPLSAVDGNTCLFSDICFIYSTVLIAMDYSNVFCMSAFTVLLYWTIYKAMVVYNEKI